MEKICFIQSCHIDLQQNHNKLYCIPQILSIENKNDWKECEANKLRRKTWITNIGCESNVPAKIYICSNHFVKGKILNLIKTK